jgi:hypothetical protein
VKITAVSTGIAFPHARLAIQVTRRRRPLTGREWRTETVHAITDLDQSQIRPDEIADILRGHWHIENRLHWIREVTVAEDHARSAPATDQPSWPCCATSPSACTAVTARTNVAAATRKVSRHPARVLPLLLQAKINTS